MLARSSAASLRNIAARSAPRVQALAAAATPTRHASTSTTSIKQSTPTPARALSTSATRLANPSPAATAAAGSENPVLPSLYSFTEEEDLLRDTVKKFSDEVVAHRVRDMDEAEKMDPEIIKGLFDNGFMGIETSADHGGAECGFTSAIVVIEELAKVDPSVSVLCDVHNTLVNTVLRHYASKDLQEKYLPELATSKLGSFCLSEPASGSDAFALQTKAVKQDNGDYILNGSKMWITNSAEAELFLVFATVDASKGYKGITCFLVEKDWGVQIAKKEQKLGIRASSTCTLNFDDLRVPAANVVGEVGKGYKIAIEILNEGRIGIAAQMLGLAQGAFNKSVAYAYERKQFGQAVGDFQAMQVQFAEAATEIEAGRLLCYNAARMKEEGRPFTKQAAMAKWYASQVANKVSRRAIEWAGGVGYTRETGIEKYYRDALIGSIYEGTSNIQLVTIAKYLKKEMGI